MQNQDRKGFLGAVGKVDGTDIVLHYKPGGKFHGEHFYTRKKRYAIDLCAVYNSNKQFIYTLTGLLIDKGWYEILYRVNQLLYDD